MSKILIVDDDVETIKLLEAIVQMDGHETSSIQESKNAIQAVESFMPDLVLLDIMMPEINGISVCKLIKSKPNIRHIKVMMVSACLPVCFVFICFIQMQTIPGVNPTQLFANILMFRKRNIRINERLYTINI